MAASLIRHPRSIAVYLFVLALVALVPAFAFSAILLQRNNEAQERVVETLITGSARSIMQAADRELTANISTLRILATTPSLLSGDLRGFYDQVTSALNGTDTFVFVLDDKFESIVSTREAFGATPVLTNDIPSAQRAIATKDVVVSNIITGRVSKRLVFNILYPVIRPGQPTLVIGLNRDAAAIAPTLLSDKLPDGWNVAMIDASGTVVASSGNAGKTGDEFSLVGVDQLETTPGLVTIRSDNRTYRGAIRKSPLTNWTLIAWAPSSVTQKPLMDAVWSLAVGGLLLAAVVVLVVYWVTLQIGRSVRGLETEAKRLGTGQPVTAQDYPISEIATVSSAIEDASKRRQAAETEVRFLMRELAHRSKNQMTVIAAMAKQTARGADSVPEFVQNFEKRIFGLARSTDLLLANGVVGVDLRELISSQIGPFSPIDDGRVTLDGPPMRLNNQAAQIIGMAAHELATNAVKYGAFGREGGKLVVSWSRENDVLHFDWRETVPNAAPPGERRGFGTTVLENMVGRSLGATVERTVHPDGLEWQFAIPATSLDPARAPDEVGNGR